MRAYLGIRTAPHTASINLKIGVSPFERAHLFRMLINSRIHVHGSICVHHNLNVLAHSIETDVYSTEHNYMKTRNIAEQANEFLS